MEGKAMTSNENAGNLSAAGAETKPELSPQLDGPSIAPPVNPGKPAAVSGQTWLDLAAGEAVHVAANSALKGGRFLVRAAVLEVTFMVSPDRPIRFRALRVDIEAGCTPPPPFVTGGLPVVPRRGMAVSFTLN